MLANLIANRLDRRLYRLAEKKDLQYSRYADDLIFSGSKERMPSLRVLYRIIQEEGFFVNVSKTKQRGKGQQQLVTGLVVSGEQAKVPKKYKKDVWKHLYYCKRFGVREHMAHVNKLAFNEWLLGRIFLSVPLSRIRETRCFKLIRNWTGLIEPVIFLLIYKPTVGMILIKYLVIKEGIL